MKKKFLDKNGLSKLVRLIKPVERVFTGSSAEWEHADKSLYDIAKVRGNDTSGTIMCSGRPVMDDLNPVTSNAAKRCFSSTRVTCQAEPSPAFSAAPGFDMRLVYLYRSGNAGLIYMRPINGTYGYDVNSIDNSVTITLPEGMKFLQPNDGNWGTMEAGPIDVYQFEEVPQPIYVEAAYALSTVPGRRSIFVRLYTVVGHSSGDAGIMIPYTSITIPVLFDDDWPWHV